MLSITAGVAVQGAAFDPFSNPGFASNCCVDPPFVVIATLITVERVCAPPMPVIVTAYTPATVAVPTRNVTVDEPLPGEAIDIGLKFAVAPAGKPDALIATEELKPFEVVVLIVEAPEPPWTIDSDDGDVEMEKSGVPLDVVTFNAKSSTTNDVLNFEFSTPSK